MHRAEEIKMIKKIILAFFVLAYAVGIIDGQTAPPHVPDRDMDVFFGAYSVAVRMCAVHPAASPWIMDSGDHQWIQITCKDLLAQRSRSSNYQIDYFDIEAAHNRAKDAALMSYRDWEKRQKEWAAEFKKKVDDFNATVRAQQQAKELLNR